MTYEEKLKLAKEALDSGSYDKETIEYIFPELKESEDEMIRKALINGFNKLDKSAVWYNGITNGQILAWLEKQGEQKPAETRKFKVGDVVKYNGTEYKITAVESNGYRVYALTYDEDAASLISFSAPAILVEHKPWSEEDEDILNTIINHFKVDIGCTDEDDMVRWLKSLKERYTWRPSDNELEVLRLAAEKDGACLMGLYEQLKKLKG